MSMVRTGIVVLLCAAAPLGATTIVSPPVVVATSPAQNAMVTTRAIDISVTFSEAMRPDGYSFVQRSAATFPKCPSPPTVSPDRKTFRLRCTVEAGRRYEIGFNRSRFTNFRSASFGVAAEPYVLRFATAATLK